ncbi:MAG: hypothetical protein IT435_16185 [Phycisphaerales bacterium]|nr:hypothetical protein [Phycisphaerales bacterium]
MKQSGPDHGESRPWRGLVLSRAFTVVELVIIMAIVAVFASLAVPRVSGLLCRQRVMQAGHRISADIQRVSASARSTSRPWTFAFTKSSSTYVVTGQDASGKGITWTVVLTDEPLAATVTDVTLGVDAKLIANGYGTLDRSGSVTLQCGKYTCVVKVDPDWQAPTVTLQ